MDWRSAPARSKRRPPTGFVIPCAPTLIGRPPRGPRWFHEIKHDGYRVVARRDGDDLRLWTRLQNEVSGRFTRIVGAIHRLDVVSCTLDGEAVVLRADGHSDFGRLRSTSGAAEAVYVVFDILELNGEDLRKVEIEKRRSTLEALLAANTCEGMLFSESFEEEGERVFEHACALGLEGIVSKRRGSRYRSGRSADWVKTLNPGYQRS